MNEKFVRLKILSIKDKQKIERSLKEQFDIEKIQGLIIQKGQERLYLYTGNLSPKEIIQIEDSIPVERLGVYFAKIMPDKGIKLSIEGVYALKDQVKKNTFSLDEKQAEEWMHGSDLQISTGKKDFIIIKHKNDFLGSGKASEFKIGNFIPKSRRLKSKG